MRKLLSAIIVFISLIACRTSSVNAQGVGINPSGTNPDNSAMLDVSSTDKGILLPRVNLASITDVATIPSPATSLMVYNTNASITGGNGTGFYYWTGTQWQAVAGNSSAAACSSAPATPANISGNSAVCNGGTGTYFVTPVATATGYTWTYSGTGATVSGTTNFVSLSFSSSATSGNLSVTATNACGASASSANFAITVNSTPNSSFNASTYSPPLGSDVYFTAAATDNQLYFWTFNAPPVANSTAMNATFTMPQTFGTSTVTLSVTKNGCTSATTNTISTPLPSYPAHGTQTFSAIRLPQAFVVPSSGVSSVQLNVTGGSGTNPWLGTADSKGGQAIGTLAVTPGQILYVFVGGYVNTGNFTAGGEAGNNRGGDASSVRTPGVALTDRVIVAGGGGGLGYNNQGYASGGNGGGSTGATGGNGGNSTTGGTGGSQSAGGNGGSGGSGGTQYPGGAGSLGMGGLGGSPYTNGGGGGGYYGGGAGGGNSGNGSAAGGGGSNYLSPALTSTSSLQGNQPGNSDGSVTITW